MGVEEKLDLEVNGMTCDSFAFHVEQAINSVEGVKGAQAPGWKSGRAAVIADSVTDTDAIIESVRRAGYKASVYRRTGLEQVAQITRQPERDGNRPDLLVIDGGSAGFAGAIKGAELRFKVTLVEGSVMGGT